MKTLSHLTSKPQINSYYCGYMQYIGDYEEVLEHVMELEMIFRRRGLFTLNTEFIDLTEGDVECIAWVWKNMS